MPSWLRQLAPAFLSASYLARDTEGEAEPLTDVEPASMPAPSRASQPEPVRFEADPDSVARVLDAHDAALRRAAASYGPWGVFALDMHRPGTAAHRHHYGHEHDRDVAGFDDPWAEDAVGEAEDVDALDDFTVADDPGAHPGDDGAGLARGPSAVGVQMSLDDIVDEVTADLRDGTNTAADSAAGGAGGDGPGDDPGGRADDRADYRAALDAVRADPNWVTLIGARLALDEALAAGEVPEAAGLVEELGQVESDLADRGPAHGPDHYEDDAWYRAMEAGGVFDDPIVDAPEPPELPVPGGDLDAAASVACAAAAAATAEPDGPAAFDGPDGGQGGDEYDRFLDSGGTVEELAECLGMGIGPDRADSAAGGAADGADADAFDAGGAAD
ncbi:hypothetical protein BJF78_35950 [Pseudonocardia sp. CNS-139]|nr:hypothetical protein BJF78_35950 [Pseudonocardia sp. CNS-139]